MDALGIYGSQVNSLCFQKILNIPKTELCEAGL